MMVIILCSCVFEICVDIYSIVFDLIVNDFEGGKKILVIV